MPGLRSQGNQKPQRMGMAVTDVDHAEIADIRRFISPGRTGRAQQQKATNAEQSRQNKTPAIIHAFPKPAVVS